MNPIGVVFCALVTSTYAIWITDIFSPRGVDVGNGLSIKLDDLKTKNSSILERLALRMDYGSFGVSVGRALKQDALEVGFYSEDKVEGRGRKRQRGNMMIPFVMGFKTAGIMAMVMSGVQMLVMKALFVAKFALVAAAVMLFAKLFKPSEENHSPYVEIEHNGSEQYPIYAEIGHSGAGGAAGFPTSSVGNYYAYSNYAPSAAGAESALNYATVTTAGNATVSGNQQVVTASKRRDYTRRKHKLPTILTVRRYSVET